MRIINGESNKKINVNLYPIINVNIKTLNVVERRTINCGT